ncbi:hypothetical protein NLI96_g6892 [Meripilus lineatus]|uniref:Uncharacterized protein n=1 Tax=Meripilus lineatus TaxID=2056292 RepID=A0AAD5V028_9APHY|nr:hypothetical protein NLI96_g6892 [Physisporinus lineatus]
MSSQTPKIDSDTPEGLVTESELCLLFSEVGVGPTPDATSPGVIPVDFDLEGALRDVGSIPQRPPSAWLTWKPGELKSWVSRKNTNIKAHLLNLDISSLRAYKGAYRAPGVPALKTIKTMNALLAKLRLIDWDGIIPELLVDAQDRIIAVLGGQPNGSRLGLVSA